jgi:hypothetical protein
MNRQQKSEINRAINNMTKTIGHILSLRIINEAKGQPHEIGMTVKWDGKELTLGLDTDQGNVI